MGLYGPSLLKFSIHYIFEVTILATNQAAKSPDFLDAPWECQPVNYRRKETVLSGIWGRRGTGLGRKKKLAGAMSIIDPFRAGFWLMNYSYECRNNRSNGHRAHRSQSGPIGIVSFFSGRWLEPSHWSFWLVNIQGFLGLSKVGLSYRGEK